MSLRICACGGMNPAKTPRATSNPAMSAGKKTVDFIRLNCMAMTSAV
jgi:hypothetical protein